MKLRSRISTTIQTLSVIALFSMPNIYTGIHKLTAHHEHFHCNARNEKHIHKEHKDCPICSYSVPAIEATVKPETIAAAQPKPTINEFPENSFYNLFNYHNIQQRAPPTRTF
ncbi:MAG: hypothetical protein RBS81_02355 [Tenuifilaceae bacterium]|jgi:hypothetical protein|nr:hypothetical protein [Tenuifilaceae bacterium]